MNLDTLFEDKKKQVISFEIFPPKKGAALRDIDATLEILSSLSPDFISITFGAGGSAVNNKTIELAKKIKEVYHVEPVVHLTCLNYTRDEIRGMLDELKEAGIYNLLALRGDRSPDYEPKKEFLHANDLIRFIREQSGDFHICAACYPETHPEADSRAADLHHLKEKVDSGATHLISQLFFDNGDYYRFLEDAAIAGICVPIEAGIMPVTNKAQIERMTTLCGAHLPEKYRRIMHKFEDKKEALFDAGMAYAINQIVDLLTNDVDGIHLYTMNNPAVARRICEGIQNLV
ncbi:MAG: methylenetetrahydrofolate reductase [NAD(P)H] [Lachnospiraceae bacterium]|jgi:methylenetetrahydrofolate reductase (NADPH)|nr:methylenetetrahydrofolate reductase [NAD(P)H] [Lachnospiraceae bacterium]